MSDAARYKVEDILKKVGIAFSATYYGEEYEVLMGNGGMDKWDCTFTNKNNKVEHFDFFTGLGLRNSRKPKPPHPADVLYAIIRDSEACAQSFIEWCGNLGCDTDSIKALTTYIECQENGLRLYKIFSHVTLNELRELLADY